MTTTFRILFLTLLCFRLHGQAPSGDQRIDDLIKRMTLEEKAGQLHFLVGETIVTGPTMHTSESAKFDEQIKAGTVTGLFNVYGAAYTARLQKIAVEQSRLGIPLLFGADIIHGFKTVTPIPLGEASSWDLGLIEASARLAADESTAAGINVNFSPMVDISRDPRWGRVSEGAGEDPYLGARIAEARVRGYQGTSLSSPTTMAACVKHFVAYGAPDGGRDYNTVDMSRRMLFETYLPPFQAAIKAGAASIMPSFNELDGIPATANRLLLEDILRKELNFQGVLISDYGAVGETINHGIAANGEEAAALCLKAGTDVDMMSFLYISKIPELVRTGKLDEKILNDAVRRVLKLKWDLGLFQNPYLYSDVERERKTIRSKEKLEQARNIAKRSMVLLKNEGQVLPLSRNVRKIAVIGPLAANKEDMNGSWSFFGEPGDPVSILEGVRAKVSPGTSVAYHRGCDLYDRSLSAIDSAVNIARDADIVIVVVGESAVMNGEGASRSDIGLPGVQLELVQALKKAGKPLVVALVNGRPLTINWIHENVPAILETWTAGSQTGHAVADILFGDYNPSGKLPMTFPRTIGQVPIYYNHKNTGRPYSGKNDEPLNQRMYVSKYRDIQNTPLYPFGFGLSYSTFVYGDVKLSQPSLQKGGKITASVTVRNSSSREGEEVVQLYIRDKVGSVTRPVKELKGFQKINLKGGESRQVTFTISPDDLAFYRADMSWGVEAGMFDVFIGGNSQDVKSASFELTDEKL